VLGAKEFAGESVGNGLRALFIFLGKVLVNNCLKGGNRGDSLEGLRGKSGE
jgi:hypothetical protein